MGPRSDTPEHLSKALLLVCTFLLYYYFYCFKKPMVYIICCIYGYYENLKRKLFLAQLSQLEGEKVR